MKREKKPPKKDKGTKKPFERITREKYEEIWIAFKDGKNYTEIAGTLNVSHPTVRKMVEVGSVARGWPPLRERLEKITARLQERIAEVHSASRVKHYEKASTAFKQGLDIAVESMRRMKEFQDTAKDKPAGEFDDQRFGMKLKNADLAAGLVQKWNDIMTALYVGEQSQQVLRDIEQFTETGDISPELKKTALEILQKGQ